MEERLNEQVSIPVIDLNSLLANYWSKSAVRATSDQAFESGVGLVRRHLQAEYLRDDVDAAVQAGLKAIGNPEELKNDYGRVAFTDAYLQALTERMSQQE